MLGWRLPRRIGRPGVVTSSVSAARRPVRAAPRRAVPRSASAASMAPRTAFATAPTRADRRAAAPRCRAGPPSAGPSCRGRRARAPRARRRPGSRAIDAEGVVAESLEVARQVGEVHVRRLPCGRPRESGTLERRRRRGPGEGRGRRAVRPGQTLFASSAILPKVAASRTARSARILRSISTSAFFRPAMNCAVGHAVLAGSRVDPDDPQLAHLALALLAVTRRVGKRVEQRLAGGLDQTRLRALAALRRPA